MSLVERPIAHVMVLYSGDYLPVACRSSDGGKSNSLTVRPETLSCHPRRGCIAVAAWHA